MKRILLLSLFTVLVTGQMLADILPATGTLNLIFFSYSGTSSSIMVDLGSGPVPTGTISYTLDTSFGRDNYWFIDFDTGSTITKMHLLLTSPLFTSLGSPPVPLEINEVGPLDSIPLVDTSGAPFELQIRALTVGGGTIQSGPFAGFVFSNDNYNFSNNTATGNSTNIGHGTGNQVNVGKSNSSNSGTVTTPSGNSQSTSGTGTGTTGTPEPSTLALSCAALVLLLVKRVTGRRS